MSVEDHFALMEMFFPSKTLHSAEYTISKAAKEATIPKLEAIQVANTLDIECDDTRISAPALMPRLPLFDVVDKVFAKLEEIKKAWPHPAAVERLKTVAKDFVRLLLAVQGLGKEKIAQAKADGRTDAVKKLEKAYKDFCMIDLTGDIDKDAEQLFLVKKITPDAFRAAMRSAFKLDREATDEINGAVNAMPTPQQPKLKHIPYKQAVAILEKMNCPKDRKTLYRWMQGKNTPEDFTPEKMTTVEAFTNWASIYSNREQAKINTNNALRIDNPNSRRIRRFR